MMLQTQGYKAFVKLMRQAKVRNAASGFIICRLAGVKNHIVYFMAATKADIALLTNEIYNVLQTLQEKTSSTSNV